MLFGLPRIIHETSGRTEIWNQYSESTRYLLNTPSVFWFSDKDYLQNWLPIRYKRHFQFSLKFMGERVPSCCFPEPDVEMKTRVQIIDLGGDSRTHKWERKEKTQERVAYWEKKKKIIHYEWQGSIPWGFSPRFGVCAIQLGNSSLRDKEAGVFTCSPNSIPV